MAIPDYQKIMLPLLKHVASDGKIKLKDLRIILEKEFKLDEAEKAALLPSGTEPIMYNRLRWAGFYLRKAGLLSQPQRGTLEITDRGRVILSENLTSINNEILNRFPEFVRFRQAGTNDESPVIIGSAIKQSESTPEESLEASHALLKNQILIEIVDRLKASTPHAFENLVVDTVVKMGYGGSLKDAGKAVGRSGDEGIDGVINEDRLGLDVIYLQAKKWEGNVSRPEIQKFAGALQGKRAKKGIFITTSDFTSEAKEYVKNIDAKIILISGKQMAELMWEHNIGMNTSAIYEIKKIDLDYFAD